MAKTVRKPRTRAQWAARIRTAHKATVKAILTLGRTLSAARKALPHGEFLKMIEHDLPFTASVAQRLMKIAANPKIANAARAQLLPPAWGTLYELTKLPEKTFEQAASSGAINRKMTREDATRLKLKIHVEEKTLRIAKPYYTTEEEPLLPPLPASLRPEASEATPWSLPNQLEQLEQLAEDLSEWAQQRGGIAAGSAAEKRIRAVANRLLSLIEQKNAVVPLRP